MVALVTDERPFDALAPPVPLGGASSCRAAPGRPAGRGVYPVPAHRHRLCPCPTPSLTGPRRPA